MIKMFVACLNSIIIAIFVLLEFDCERNMHIDYEIQDCIVNIVKGSLCSTISWNRMSVYLMDK